MPEHKCTLGDGITIKPDGRSELDPCLYQEIEAYENVTVHVLRCVRCGYEHDQPETTTPYCPECGAGMNGMTEVTED